ncbi:maleylpyruvate isomerase family mycothiol-dependent enzyme [Actinomadura vinacea]|uniref:Maleylpyruvate isomerase family mycothiol-dependent enzyme n=1 Tax=Actinomadura vinacea TaxID=115336 RepID=A0ABN3K4B7_9ACTN
MNASTPPADRLAAGLREQTGALADAVAGAEPGHPVPTCPEWTVKDLVEHVGAAQRWSSDLVASRAAGPESLVPPAVDVPPADWASWLREGADRLAEEGLREAGTRVWTFLGPRPAAFWLRRILHDTSVHHADAALALGRPFALADDLAADAISEGLELLSWPGAARQRPALAELRGDGETLCLQPPGGDGWIITRTPEGIAWERGAPGSGDVVLHARVSDLLLVFSRRLPPDDPRVTVKGDGALLDHWLARTAF